uniref:Uncharacterized protein n=1 Tax=Coccidioides posadasii RMSCC 3488 TaxID=454284 RepID=A0A0J6I1X1_COCPO|nr:hypothetical protein CPAG_01633 [Coccidioides posadasii RMSCC 3488]
MPSSHSVSPVKRSVSSPQAPPDHSAMPRHSSSTTAAHQPQPHKSTVHKSHRPYVVGTHRVHGRTQSHKNLNKLHRLALVHNLPVDGVAAPPTPFRHQRKKSAPVSPSTSPRTNQNHVRWNQSTIPLTAASPNTTVRKNLSTPALRRNGSGILVKKTHVVNQTEKAETSEKKTVGFTLVDSDGEDEWEDHSSISASSTRRNSIVSGKMNGQNSLTASVSCAKSPLVQESHNTDINDKNVPRQEEQLQKGHARDKDAVSEVPSDQTRASDQHLIASRILHHPHSSKVPPAISSVSATATPLPSDRSPRSSSFANLASSLNAVSHSPAPSTLSSMAMNNPHAASSSAEGGVSRFLINSTGPRTDPRFSSGPSTPSSFLPHYHPQSPPSPESTALRRSKSPKPSNNGPIEPHSRTQQKLWLQRTATMSNSPPDTFIPGIPATSTIDSNYVAGAQSRPGTGGYGPDGRRFMIGATGSTGVSTDGEIKRSRKIYDRFTTEYSVVHRFKNPVVDSFKRLRQIPGSSAGGKLTRVNSARDLVNGHDPSRPQSREDMLSATAMEEAGVGSQFLSKTHSMKQSQVRFQGQDGIVHVGEVEQGVERLHLENPPSRTSVHTDGNTYGQQVDDHGDVRTDSASYHPTESELLIRRMWESREVPVAGE